MQKTTNYDMFKFRDDNRSEISQSHVKKLAMSIKMQNLLELKPILVNEDMEVMDGQHRLLAAKQLGVEVYYSVEKKLNASNMVLMNLAKPWGIGDYLNYYCKNGNKEYIKLDEFTKSNGVSLKVALNLTIGTGREAHTDFKMGRFQFLCEELSAEIECCKAIIQYIKKMNGFSLYTDSSRFWKALIKLVKHPNFRMNRWSSNLEKMISRVGPRATTEDYMRMLMEIYNWKNSDRVYLLEEGLWSA